MICERCGQETFGYTTSYFNTEKICLERCQPAERAHPLFAEAKRIETEAVIRGDYNFPGIGLPEDLKMKKGESV